MIKDGKIFCNNCNQIIDRKLDSKAKRYTNHFCCKQCEGEYRTGKLTHPRKQNDIILNEDFAIIKIKNNKYGNYDCLIDLDDVEKIKEFYWNIRYDKRHPNHTGYIESVIRVNRTSNKRIHLHRLVMNCPDDKIIDHINGNTLDNRKNNLRICTQNYNGKNRQFAKNIYYSKRDKRYIVCFHIDGKYKYLCFTRDLKEAETYASIGRKLITENKINELLSMECKSINS